MSLQPPSYFSAPRDSGNSSAVRNATSTALDSTDPGEELTVVSRENDKLRLRLLETERRELTNQVERAQLLLDEKEQRHATEMAEIKLLHRAEISKVESERDMLLEEYNQYKTENESRAEQLQRELTSSEHQHTVTIEELNTRLKELEQSNTALATQLSEETAQHRNTVEQLTEQLGSSEAENEALKQEMDSKLNELRVCLEAETQRVVRLESYLGGELPESSLTWREERASFIETMEVQQSTIERLQSESKLINIRLTSLSEILSIQESEIAKSQCNDGDRPSVVKCLLTRWREKVFVLILQQKLQQMEDSQTKTESEKETARLLEKLSSMEVENEKLLHSLNDKSAQLELQATATQDSMKDLALAHSVIEQLELKISQHREQAALVENVVQNMADEFNKHKAVFCQAMSKISSLEQRLTFTSKRLNSIAAAAGCKLAMLHARARPLPPLEEAGCQTNEPLQQRGDLTSFSRERLEQELLCVVADRDSLAAQLRESTLSFQEQITQLNNTCQSRLSVVEKALCDIRQENDDLSSHLTDLQSVHDTTLAEREDYQQRVEELQTQLRDSQATLETRIETAVQKTRQEGAKELTEMEALVNVARREHSKAVVQLQQLQRQFDRGHDRAVQAVEIDNSRLQHELDSCRKKLQAIQVERNLLMTTLRQEGFGAPMRQPPAYHGAADSDSEASDPGTNTVEQATSSPNDFITVLKDLQTLSVSLLDMDKAEQP